MGPWSGSISIGCPISCGRWPDGPKATSISWAGIRPESPEGRLGHAERRTTKMQGVPARWCTRQDFTGKVGEPLVFHAARTTPIRSSDSEGDVLIPETDPPTAMVLVGLGGETKRVGVAGLETLRRGTAAFIRAAGSGDAAAFVLPRELVLPLHRVSAAVAEGALLGSYRYAAFRTAEPPAGLGRLVVITE